MTTTSQQPAAGEPNPAGQPGGGPEGGARPGSGRQGGRGGRGDVAVAAAVVVALLVIAALAWLFLAGPLSSSARAERDVEQTLESMSSAESFAEFNGHMCAENRVPQELVDTITASSEATGSDLDSMFRESIAGSFPQDLEVLGVEISDNGAEATATVESESDGTGPEQIHMRDEDGAWKMCQPGVGMGAVPQDQQPG
ncbi:Rv0361 family membrane protein [Dietzia maris]|uniref:Rv0361 family membrane protein n=2 Tax=Dietzia TaxID=37914 RepID=UPI0037CA3714